MNTHAPEPWYHVDKSSGVYSSEATIAYGNDILHSNEANMRRIVACVNACAGISTEALENNGVGELLLRVKQAVEMSAEAGSYTPSYAYHKAAKETLVKVLK